MKNYEIDITEVLGTYFVIQANSKEEAARLFSDWAATENAVYWIADKLGDSSNGWEFSDPVETPEAPDVPYDKMMDEINSCKGWFD